MVTTFCEFVLRFCIIFSSIKALTLMLAVCSGGPETSFFSHFLASESYQIKNKTLLVKATIKTTIDFLGS